MVLLPVIDLKGSCVVHGRAGQRETYRPIQSEICEGASPDTVAAAFHQLGFADAYVADLDAIDGGTLDHASLDAIIKRLSTIWLDAGTGDAALAGAVEAWANGRNVQLVCGLESVQSIRRLKELIERFGSKLIISVDLFESRVRSPVAAWSESTPENVTLTLLRMGVQRLILLDLSRVGTGRGTGTRQLCRFIREQSAKVEIVCGGGVRNRGDIDDLLQDGCNRVLVASALHNGRIRPSDFSDL